MPARMKVFRCLRLPTKFADFAYESGRSVCYRAIDECEIIKGTRLPVSDCYGQGRRMLKDNREYLELERLEKESRKLVAERQKLLAEEKKLNRETSFYPLAVLAGVATAVTAIAGVFFKL